MHLALVVIACVACTGSSKPAVRAKNVSADRANPTRIELASSGNSATTTIKAGAPGAGTWWYVVETPQPAGARATFEFATSYSRGKPGKVTFALVTDDKTIAATTSPGSRVARLVLPEATEAPSLHTLQVTTTEATRFEIHATSTWHVDVVVPPDPAPPLPPVAPTRCADLNRPDFHDPACCRARCTFGDLKCRSKVISGGGRSATIALSARDEIMAYAKGWLYINNHAVSEVIVTHVGETESSVLIASPDDVDMTKLVASGMVILSPPAACKR